MRCEACGHDPFEHNIQRYSRFGEPYREGITHLCEVCYWETGPCFPWEFR